MFLTQAVLVFFLGISANAVGPQTYANIAALKRTDFFRLTCSDTHSAANLHFHAVVERGRVRELQFITVYPGLSMIDRTFTATDVSGLNVGFRKDAFNISGTRPGAYWSESLDLTIRDGRRGLVGKLNYNDGDGTEISRHVQCGALNHLVGVRE